MNDKKISLLIGFLKMVKQRYVKYMLSGHAHSAEPVHYGLIHERGSSFNQEELNSINSTIDDLGFHKQPHLPLSLSNDIDKQVLFYTEISGSVEDNIKILDKLIEHLNFRMY